MRRSHEQYATSIQRNAQFCLFEIRNSSLLDKASFYVTLEVGTDHSARFGEANTAQIQIETNTQTGDFLFFQQCIVFLQSYFIW